MRAKRGESRSGSSAAGPPVQRRLPPPRGSHRRSSSATRREASRRPSGRRRIFRPDRTAPSARGTWPTPRPLDRPGPWLESFPTSRRRNRVDVARGRIEGRPRNGPRPPRIPLYCRPRGRRSASSFLRVTIGGGRRQRDPRWEDGFELLKPFFHLGERLRPPLRLVRDERDRGPDDPVREASVFGGLEESIQVILRRQLPPAFLHRFAVEFQDGWSLFEREAQEEGGEVVAERADPSVVPVDQAQAQTVRTRNDEDVLGPKVPMEQRLGSSRLLHEPSPVGKLPTKGVETPQQPLTQGFVTRAGGPTFERIDGVSHIRLEEMHPEVAAMKPDFPQQRVTGEASVEPGDLFHGCLDRFGAGVPWIQPVRAEIVVHMPDARAGVVGDAACQRRPQGAQTDRGQPAFDRQFDSPGGGGTQSLGDQRDRLAVDPESEAKHPPGLRLQPGVAQETYLC